MIRVQSPFGTKRIEITNDSLSALYDKVVTEFNIESKTHWRLYSDRNKNNLLPNTRNTNAKDLLSHGEMIFLFPVESSTTSEEVSNASCIEDDVDIELAKQDGKIQRGRDEQL